MFNFPLPLHKEALLLFVVTEKSSQTSNVKTLQRGKNNQLKKWLSQNYKPDIFFFFSPKNRSEKIDVSVSYNVSNVSKDP